MTSTHWKNFNLRRYQYKHVKEIIRSHDKYACVGIHCLFDTQPISGRGADMWPTTSGPRFIKPSDVFITNVFEFRTLTEKSIDTFFECIFIQVCKFWFLLFQFYVTMWIVTEISKKKIHKSFKMNWINECEKWLLAKVFERRMAIGNRREGICMYCGTHWKG